MNRLKELAEHCGIQPEFTDISGNRHAASPEALTSLLAALGEDVPSDGSAPSASDLTAALHEKRSAKVRALLAPVTTSWLPDRPELRLRLPSSRLPTKTRIGIEDDQASLSLEVELPSLGTAQSVVGESRVIIVGQSEWDGETWVEIEVTIELTISPGRYCLTVECAGERATGWLLYAPRRAVPLTQNSWGLFAPTYALHGGKRGGIDFGVGGIRQLGELMDFAAERGADFVGTLPLLPAFYREQFNPSPYSPVSRLFWNELFLDLDLLLKVQPTPAANELMASSEFERERAQLCEASLVDYARVAELERSVVELASEAFFAAGVSEDFHHYLAQHPHAERYAAFRALSEREKKPWRSWPAKLHAENFDTRALAELERDESALGKATRYHLYAQWRTSRQMDKLGRTAATGLYLDLPIGAHEAGFDTWSFPESFLLGVSAGAPADMFFTKGQNWGFLPPHPTRTRLDGHAYLFACLEHHMKIPAVLRLDHVMALHRLYCIPEGMEATQGVYVGYPAEELYALLSIASHRHDCAVVGENLGTVPEGVPEAMREHGLTGMVVSQFEFSKHQPAMPVPHGDVMASLNTHDMPTFGGYLSGADIDDRIDLGLMSPEDAQPEREERRQMLWALADHFGLEEPNPQKLLERTLTVLANSDVTTVLVTLEDLWLEPTPQNVPGTSFERPNWRRKLRHALSELEQFADRVAPLQKARHRRDRATEHAPED